MSSLKSELEQGLAALAITASEQQIELLLGYLALLKKWNRAYNLVSDADERVLLYRHLLDSIAICDHIDAGCVLDVGTGAGLPGVPLAILKPQTEFILLDSNGKKTRFLFEVKLALGIANISVENCRVEHYQSPRQIDIVTCRAFSSLKEILHKVDPLMGPGSHLLAMKGHYPEEEITELGSEYMLANAIKLNVPGSESERHLIDIAIR